jgi:hypothetical protein
MSNDKFEEIQRSLGRIEGMLTPLSEEVTAHDKRLRKLEGYKHYLMGAIVVISGIATYIFEWFKNTSDK